MPFNAADWQKEIYLSGLAGKMPLVPHDAAALEQKAAGALTPEAFAYIAGGAGAGSTMQANRSAFEKWHILPRMLRDVSVRETSVELFGSTLPYPVLLAPIGVLEMAHPQADLAVGRAAAALGLPFIFSSQASFPMEQVAAEMGQAPRWFQLYWSKSDQLVESFVKRAEACGCQAIVLTLDTTLLGWRTQDLDLAYLPFLRGMGIAQYVSDPVFQQLLEQPDEPPVADGKRKVTLQALQGLWQMANKHPGSTLENLRSGRALAAVRQFVSIYSRPSLTWDHLGLLREMTRLPILLKGILHPDDARKAVAYGMDGVMVSNHGGRQVDGALGALDALPGVLAAVNRKVPVLMDSGIRNGADVFKALALGAQAVCVGRPYAYGLALGGQAGVEAVLKNLLASFELNMALAGCKSISEIDAHCVQPAS